MCAGYPFKSDLVLDSSRGFRINPEHELSPKDALMVVALAVGNDQIISSLKMSL